MDIKRIQEETVFKPEKMQKVNLFETRNMFCDIYCLEPGQEQAVHSHEGNDKIYYVLEGRGAFTVGEETRDMSAGDITCAFSGMPHGVLNNSDARLTCLVYMAPHPKPQRFE